MQGHSVESTLPPLPENGPTAETVALELDVRGLDNSPVPSATSQDEENDETTEATEERPIAAAAEVKAPESAFGLFLLHRVLLPRTPS